MTLPSKKVELLSPAGDWDCLKAACANGADAAYFGLDKFNARHRATNFSLEDLTQVMDYLHQRNVRGFVAFNILIFPGELVVAQDYLKSIARSGADAIIVQDPALALLAKKIAPSLEVHASTQMTITDTRGADFAKELGASQAVLARELSTEQVATIGKESQIPLEVFVHGALCVAYSGQCLTSEALGGRSANRGQCAQACRLPYELLVDGKDHDLGDRAYLLSPQDLAGYEQIPELIQAGVTCFKIEGRMKGPAYVASTTRFYRKAIDQAIAGLPFDPSFQDHHDLTMAFSRGFTPGFFEGNNHQRLVQGRFPKNRGLLLGTLVKSNANKLVIAPQPALQNNTFPLQPGDGIVIDLGKPAEKEPGGRVELITFLKSNQIEIVFHSNEWTNTQPPKGSLVWKTDDPEFKKRMASTWARDGIYHRKTVDFHLQGAVGGSLKLLGKTDEVNADAVWPGPLETARNANTGESLAKQQLGRLGNSPFSLGKVELNLNGDPMIPSAILNSLRREVVEKLLKQKEHAALHPILEENPLAVFREKFPPAPPRLDPQPQLTVLVRNLAQLDAVLQWAPEQKPLVIKTVYCDFENTRLYSTAVERGKASGIPIALATFRINKPGEDGFLQQLIRCQPDGLLIRNISTLRLAKQVDPALPLFGDWSLNVVNDLTAHLLLNEGLQRLAPGNDLNAAQLIELLNLSNPSQWEIPAHLHMPMFHMEHCVFAAFLSKGKDHRDCGRPCERHQITLRDRVGEPFPVHVDAGCRNTVYNSVAQSCAEYLPRLRLAGGSLFRVELLRHTPNEVTALLNGYYGCLIGRVQGKELWRTLKASNQYGLTRGTLSLL